MSDGEWSSKEGDVVVLLHGIGHSLWNMALMEKRLRREGYKTVNLSYPSRKHNIEALSVWLNDRLQSEDVWSCSGRVHFVTHSMGGLVTQHYLDTNKEGFPSGKLGRVVMLGPPHRGSEVADFLHKVPLYRWVFGPAGQELTTSVRAKVKITPWYELGVIAGTKNWMYPLGVLTMKGVNDGCVSVESTKIDGMKEHITLPLLHGFMGWNKTAQSQTANFLKTGGFNHVR